MLRSGRRRFQLHLRLSSSLPLTDNATAYPLKGDGISLPVVAIISLVAPAAITGAVNRGAVLLTKSKKSEGDAAAGVRDRIVAVIWATHAGLLGLCAGLADTLFVTAGLKDMVGKPRPDVLARCQPDLTKIGRYVVGTLWA